MPFQSYIETFNNNTNVKKSKASVDKLFGEKIILGSSDFYRQGSQSIRTSSTDYNVGLLTGNRFTGTTDSKKN